MQPNAASNSTAPAPAPVAPSTNRTADLYLTNFFGISTNRAQLSWSADQGIISLQIQNGTGGQWTQAFSVPFDQVQKADVSIGRTMIKVAGKKYVFNVHMTSNVLNGTGGPAALAGIAHDTMDAKSLGLEEMIELLRQHGVKATKPRYFWLVVVPVLTVLGLMVLFYLFAIFMTAIGKGNQQI